MYHGLLVGMSVGVHCLTNIRSDDVGFAKGNGGGRCENWKFLLCAFCGDRGSWEGKVGYELLLHRGLRCDFGRLWIRLFLVWDMRGTIFRRLND